MRRTKWSRLALAGVFIGLIIWIIFLRSSFGTSGCPILARLRPIQVVPATNTDFVELDWQSGMGFLPHYTVRIQGDGQVDWEGEECVAAKGHRRGQINPQAAKALIDHFQAHGFCRLCRNYYPDATDLGAVRLTLSVHSKRQDVIAQSLHSTLLIGDLSQEIQRAAQVDQWIGDLPAKHCGLR